MTRTPVKLVLNSIKRLFKYLRNLIYLLNMKRIFFTLMTFAFLGALGQGNLNMTLLGQLPYTQDLNDIWGYVDSVGNEYAIVGTRTGTSIVDVSNPATPIEKAFIPGPSSTWRDIKTWGHYAYVTHDSYSGTSQGLLIIDLSDIATNPSPTFFTYFPQALGSTLDRAHNLYIDENGICYLFGANNGVGGAILLDVDANATAPPVIGTYNEYYLHDGMARGDTLWGGAIYQGEIVVIDVSNPAMISNNIGAAATPDAFCHNGWISQDGTHVFTTDEVQGAYVAAYDVTNLANITEVDRIQPEPNNGVIPHNTHVKGEAIYTSWYTSGAIVHDVTYPYNIIRVGQYDTSPLSGGGFNGCWGLYPFAPSGNLYASDIEGGLFILGYTETQACYLEGTVTDAGTTMPIATATIELLNTGVSKPSDLSGFYATGLATAGTYDAVYSAPGYIADTFQVVLSNGVLVTQDAALSSVGSTSIDGSVLDESGSAISGIEVFLSDGFNEYSGTTDANGQVVFNSIFQGTYEVTAGAWGYRTYCATEVIDGSTSSLTINLTEGYYDDFAFDYGWTEIGNATTGAWERGEPVGTYSGGVEINPETDVQGDCSDKAFVTGNGGGTFGTDDVDDGFTLLRSPIMDLSAYADPYMSVYTWIALAGGSGAPYDDTLVLTLSDGSNIYEIERIADANPQSQWVQSNFRILDYTNDLSAVQFRAEISDLTSGGGNIVEAGIDQFEVADSGSGIGIIERDALQLIAYPNPASTIITLERNVDGSDLQIDLIDVTGRVLNQFALKSSDASITLDIKEYDSGVYFFRLSDGSNIKWMKQ